VSEVERGLGAMRVIHSAQFEISIDGVPRTYRDRKVLALLATQILKSRNSNSVVMLKDLKTGKETVIAFKAAQQQRHGPHHPPQVIGEAGRGTANPAYESTGAVGGDCWPSISSPGFPAALPR